MRRWMNKLRRTWRSFFRKKNKQRRAKAAKRIDGRPPRAIGSVPAETESTTTGVRRRRAIDGEQRTEARRNQRPPADGNQRTEARRDQPPPARVNQGMEARRNQRVPAGGNQRAERGNDQRDPALLAKRASAIGKFVYLDPETALKLPDADRKK